jgi:hypothetical protein
MKASINKLWTLLFRRLAGALKKRGNPVEGNKALAALNL